MSILIGSGLMNLCWRIIANGMTIARIITSPSAIVAARTRSFIFPFSFPFFSGVLSVDLDAPLSVYRLACSVTTIVAVGISRYGVLFFALGWPGGSRYCVGVSARWYVVRRWERWRMARLYGFETLRYCPGDWGSERLESGVNGFEREIVEYGDMWKGQWLVLLGL